MKNEMIAKALRYYRQQRQLSVQEVTQKLKENQITLSPKTIYSWENGTTQPDVNMLFQLCSIYEITDVMKAFGYTNTPSANLLLSPEEEALVQAYRNQPQMKDAVKRLLQLD